MSGHLNDFSFIRLNGWIINNSFDKLIIRMNVWTLEQLNAWTSEPLFNWTSERLNNWTIERLNIWTSERLNVWTEERPNIQLYVRSQSQTDIQSCEHGFETLSVWEKFNFHSRFSSIAKNSSCPCMSAFCSEQFCEYAVITFTKEMLPSVLE